MTCTMVQVPKPASALANTQTALRVNTHIHKLWICLTNAARSLTLDLFTLGSHCTSCCLQSNIGLLLSTYKELYVYVDAETTAIEGMTSGCGLLHTVEPFHVTGT